MLIPIKTDTTCLGFSSDSYNNSLQMLPRTIWFLLRLTEQRRVHQQRLQGRSQCGLMRGAALSTWGRLINLPSDKNLALKSILASLLPLPWLTNMQPKGARGRMKRVQFRSLHRWGAYISIFLLMTSSYLENLVKSHAATVPFQQDSR